MPEAHQLPPFTGSRKSIKRTFRVADTKQPGDTIVQLFYFPRGGLIPNKGDER